MKVIYILNDIVSEIILKELVLMTLHCNEMSESKEENSYLIILKINRL